MNWTKDEQKEHRRLWVEALRSGKYAQTVGNLRDERGFCCLGVACDISGLGEWSTNNLGDECYDTPDYKSFGTLEDAVRTWLGLRCGDGALDGNKYFAPTVSLASKNDGGTSFAEIADIIESEPKGLIEE